MRPSLTSDIPASRVTPFNQASNRFWNGHPNRLSPEMQSQPQHQSDPDPDERQADFLLDTGAFS